VPTAVAPSPRSSCCGGINSTTSDLYDKQDATPNQIIVERDSSPEYVYLIGADNLNLFRIKGGN